MFTTMNSPKFRNLSFSPHPQQPLLMRAIYDWGNGYSVCVLYNPLTALTHGYELAVRYHGFVIGGLNGSVRCATQDEVSECMGQVHHRRLYAHRPPPDELANYIISNAARAQGRTENEIIQDYIRDLPMWERIIKEQKGL